MCRCGSAVYLSCLARDRFLLVSNAGQSWCFKCNGSWLVAVINLKVTEQKRYVRGLWIKWIDSPIWLKQKVAQFSSRLEFVHQEGTNLYLAEWEGRNGCLHPKFIPDHTSGQNAGQTSPVSSLHTPQWPGLAWNVSMWDTAGGEPKSTEALAFCCAGCAVGTAGM